MSDRGEGHHEQRELVAAVVDLVTEQYLDRDYVASPDWGRTRAGLAAAVGTAGFEERVVGLVRGLPLSHTQLLPPAIVARVRASSAGAMPSYLRTVFRAGPRWTYLKLPSLTLPAFSRAGLAALERRTPGKPVVLDLRLNDGGAASSLGEVLGAFLGPDYPYLRTALVRDEDSDPRVVRPFAEAGNADHESDVAAIAAGPTEWLTPAEPVANVTEPLVVLVGPRCHSCGEVLAQVLHEQAGALTVGAPTAGAVVAAREHALPAGWALSLPFAWMTTPAGTELEGTGVRLALPRRFADDTRPPSDRELDEVSALLD